MFLFSKILGIVLSLNSISPREVRALPNPRACRSTPLATSHWMYAGLRHTRTDVYPIDIEPPEEIRCHPGLAHAYKATDEMAPYYM